MTLTGSRSLLLRLQHDLSELVSNPYPGVDVHIDDSNIRKFCLVLTPPSGPWKDLSLHFDVELPNGWPASPPMIFSSVEGISHPNINANYICCDLLKEQDELPNGYSGGYTPALTLRGLFLQFLTFFSSTKVEQTNGSVIDIGDYKITKYVLQEDPPLHSLWTSSPHEEEHVGQGTTVKPVCIPVRKVETINPRWQTAYNLVKKFKCKSCPYNTPQLPIHAVIPPTPLTASPPTGYLTPSSLPSPTTSITPPAKPLIKLPSNPRRRKTGCSLDILPSDLLLYLASFLPTSSDLLSLSTAYPRFHALTLGHSQLTHKMLFADELRCFYLRTPLNHGLSSLTSIHPRLIGSGDNPHPSKTPVSTLPSLTTINSHLSLSPPVLGIGISFHQSFRTLHSDFDFLSYEAFSVHNVRKSVISKSSFDYFLPLALGRDHFGKAKDKIWECLHILDGAVARSEPSNMSQRDRERNGQKGRGARKPPRTPLYIHPPPHHWQTVRVIYRMMNNIVVSLMKTCDNVMEWERERREKNRQREQRRRVTRRMSTLEIAAELNAQQAAEQAQESVGLGLGLGLVDAPAAPAGGLLFSDEPAEDDLGLFGGAGMSNSLGLLTFDEPTPLVSPQPLPSEGGLGLSMEVDTSLMLESSGGGSTTTTPVATIPPAGPLHPPANPPPTTAAPPPAPAPAPSTASTSHSAPTPTLLHASERSIISYLHLFHLLLCLCRAHPEILQEARRDVEEFIRGGSVRVDGGDWKNARAKERTRDLGEFIVKVLVVLAWRDEDSEVEREDDSSPFASEYEFDGSETPTSATSRISRSWSTSSTTSSFSTGTNPDSRKPLSWSQINGPFLEEAITRNVYWCLKAVPVLECLEEGTKVPVGKSPSVARAASTMASSVRPAGVALKRQSSVGGTGTTTTSAATSYASLAATLPPPPPPATSSPTDLSISWSERFRLEKTFESSLTSLRLIMFQVAFLDVFVGGLDGPVGGDASNSSTRPDRTPSTPFYDPHHDPRSLLTRLDASYGYPPDPSIPEKMVKSIKAIYGVRTWPMFFERVRWRRGRGLFEVRVPVKTPSSSNNQPSNGSTGYKVVVSNTSPKFVAMLRDAVNKSAERGYHVTKRPREMHLLWTNREKAEKVWIGDVKERERVEKERELREARERRRKESAGGGLGPGQGQGAAGQSVGQGQGPTGGLGLGLTTGTAPGAGTEKGKGKEVRWFDT